MKKTLILLFALATSAYSSAQVGAAVNIEGEATIDYLFKNFRFGITFQPSNDIAESILPTISYEAFKKEKYDLYIGAAYDNISNSEYLRIPLGVDIIPLNDKNFSIYAEMVPQINLDSDKSAIRGNLGIRYRFNKEGNRD
ncbi:MAG: hypothetical protein N4A74_06075 [Carboxylicivirga sp.]|jgi:hypothetical protein|nr:hypothetical protein [Carboxylicivirga sp.]